MIDFQASPHDPHIRYRLDGAVFILQIHRPEKKNAITHTMYKALAESLKEADVTPAVKVIMLCGSADCFTSGNDINDFVSHAEHAPERAPVPFMKTIAQLRKPLVAVVNGLAIGIGTTLLLHCDLVYAAEDAWLQLPFTRLGLCPEAGSSLLAPLLMGHQRAAELLLLGERFSAEKAREFGLVSEVLPAEKLLAYALQKAQALAALPGPAVETTKHLLKRQHSAALDETMALELVNFSRLLHSEEAQDILQAFLAHSRT